jgi:hypothetical protein
MVMNFGFHKILRNFLVTEQLAVSQGGLSSMELVKISCCGKLKTVS